jgi:16S rRNA (adenine1518-N6/adenine1519-N6)-dimethyltransferase
LPSRRCGEDAHVPSPFPVEARLPDVPREEVFAVVDAAFAQRRKVLRAALARWAGGLDAAGRILRGAGVDPGARGEELTVAQFTGIAQHADAGGPGQRS